MTDPVIERSDIDESPIQWTNGVVAIRRRISWRDRRNADRVQDVPLRIRHSR
jgi:hypothetical protein